VGIDMDIKSLANKIAVELQYSGLWCRIGSYSRRGNSVYLRLKNQKDRYWSLRISDHKSHMQARYNLCLDLDQSHKEQLGQTKYYSYCLNDLKPMLNKIKKECTNGFRNN
jgi:hypothetical protein